jgi:hypothetical protein
MASSQSLPLSVVNEAGNKPSSSLAMCSCSSTTASRIRCWSMASATSTVASRSASLPVLRDERGDVAGELLLALHDREDAVLLTLPVGCESDRHLVDAPTRLVEVAGVDRPDRVAAEVGDPLVLRDVVTDQGHVAAAAVVTHRAAYRSTRCQPRRGVWLPSCTSSRLR